MTSSSASSRFSWVLQLGFVALMTGYLVWCGRAPTIDAAQSEFSVERAMVDLKTITAIPHPIGSEANAAVRAALVERLQSMGVNPRVQSAPAVSEYGVVAYVNNIVATLPGSGGGGKALLLAAHYDSVRSGPGAGDDGASVAAILETLRLLKTTPLKNDVIVLLSDGEEAGMLGAEAFVASDADAKRVGLALNFEFRGNAGPMVLFETSAGNGALVSTWAKHAVQPRGSSLLYEIYKLMPNGTDLGVLKRAGIPGMNFAGAENAVIYHSRLDSAENLDRDTFRHQGALMLSLAREFGNAPLDSFEASDAVFFDVPLLGVVHYGSLWVWPLLALVVLPFLAVVAILVRRREVRASRLIAAVVGTGFAMLVSAGMAFALWALIARANPAYAGIFTGLYATSWYLLGFALFSVGAQALVLWCLRRVWTQTEYLCGASIVALMLLVLLTVVAPGATFVLTWPLLLATAGVFFGEVRRDATLSLVLHILAALAGIVLMLPLVRFGYVGLGPDAAVVIPILIGVFLCAAGGIAAALHRGAVIPLLMLVGGVGVCVAAGFALPFSAERPRADDVAYFQYAEGKALWLSRNEDLDDWQRTVLGAEAKYRAVPEVFGDSPRSYWVTEAPALNLAAPTIEIVTDTTSAATRHVVVRVASQRGSPRITLAVRGARVQRAAFENKTISATSEEHWSVDLYALPPTGVTLDLDIDAGKPLEFAALDSSYGLPAATPPRGADTMMGMTPFGDTTTVLTRKTMP